MVACGSIQEVCLPPIRRGYPYAIVFNFPASWLAVDETLRGELRQTPSQTEEAATFAVGRVGDAVTLSLDTDDTEDLPARQHVLDLTLVLANDDEIPLAEHRFVIPVQNHVTRATEAP